MSIERSDILAIFVSSLVLYTTIRERTAYGDGELIPLDHRGIGFRERHSGESTYNGNFSISRRGRFACAGRARAKPDTSILTIIVWQTRGRSRARTRFAYKYLLARQYSDSISGVTSRVSTYSLDRKANMHC